MKLNGQIDIVTSAARRFGEGIANRFAADRAKVVGRYEQLEGSLAGIRRKLYSVKLSYVAAAGALVIKGFGNFIKSIVYAS